jgi:CheY-like chemotaxis protein
LIERRPADADAVRRIARMVFDAAGRGSSVTRRLLAFSRRGDLRAEPIDATALLTDMREILTHTLGTGIGVRVDIAPGLPPLFADKGQLETALINLAGNARDAMHGKGAIVLAAALLTVTVSEHNLQPGAYVCVSVSDTGAGMSPEVIARATEPFFTTKRKGEGTGLGLAMARGFAEPSGGALTIDSSEGRGTTIRLFFPVAEASRAVARAGGAEAAAVEGQRRFRLLVVDDEPLVREIIVEQMQAEGYAAVAAAGGPEALAILDAGEEVDLIISDFSMPVMDGVALVGEVQRRRPRLPAILLTGFATNAAEIAVSGAVSGTFSLLRKPISGPQLAERVALMLEAAAVARSPAG